MKRKQPTILTKKRRKSFSFGVLTPFIFIAVVTIYLLNFHDNIYGYFIGRLIFFTFITGMSGWYFVFMIGMLQGAIQSHSTLVKITVWFITIIIGLLTAGIAYFEVINLLDGILWVADQSKSVEGFVQDKWFDHGRGIRGTEHYFIQVGSKIYELVEKVDVEIGDYVKIEHLPFTNMIIDVDLGENPLDTPR